MRGQEHPRLRQRSPRHRTLDRDLHAQPRRGGAPLRPDRDHPPDAHPGELARRPEALRAPGDGARPAGRIGWRGAPPARRAGPAPLRDGRARARRHAAGRGSRSAARQPGASGDARGARRADRRRARGSCHARGRLPPDGRRDRRPGPGLTVRIGYVGAVFGKEWRDLVSNRVLLGAVAFPAVIFAAIPTGLVAFIQARNLDPNQIGQIQQYIAQFPDLSPKLAAEAFIVTNFMAYFLIIPAMVPMALATQSVIGEKQARSLEPQLATPIEVPELLAGKTIAAALPAVLATWAVFLVYGLVNGAIADTRLTRLVFSDTWLFAMASLVPLICLFSVLLGIVVSSRVTDARTAQQIGGFVVLPIIGIAVAQFFGGQATFTFSQVVLGDLVVLSLIGVVLAIGSWAFDRESILTRLG
ncbi:MAG: ABC transporter permease [Chloroflexi bacterium]|nr:MAG: ABC transporter permease [Chloroflexota bacterium]